MSQWVSWPSMRRKDVNRETKLAVEPQPARVKTVALQSSYELRDWSSKHGAYTGQHQVLWVHSITFCSVFFFWWGAPECMNEWVSDSHISSWGSFPVSLPCPTSMWWLSFPLIPFYKCHTWGFSLRSLLFSNGRQKGLDEEVVGRNWEEQGRGN